MKGKIKKIENYIQFYFYDQIVKFVFYKSKTFESEL